MRFTGSEWLSGGLAIIGALNWGFVGLFGFNLVHALFGWSRPIERLIYATVGLAGAWFALSIAQPRGETRGMNIKERMEQEHRSVGVI